MQTLKWKYSDSISLLLYRCLNVYALRGKLDEAISKKNSLREFTAIVPSSIVCSLLSISIVHSYKKLKGSQPSLMKNTGKLLSDNPDVS